MKTQNPYVKLLHLPLIFLALIFSNAVSGQILLQSSFEGSNPFAGFTNNQSCCSYSVTASTNHPHDGSQSFRAEVRANDPAVSSGYRAELTTNGASDQGDMWYGFSIYFETPVSGSNWLGGYGGHFIQWHPGNGTGSAELAIYGSDGVWDVTVNPSGGAGGTHQSTTASGGQLKQIIANTWHDVVFHVVWGSGGKVEMWLNGELYFTKSNLNWASGAYLKLGMNRWSMTNTWVIYYDNIKIGRNVTYNDVAPTASGTPTNQTPTANAGTDKTITLPTNTTTLTGSGTDPDGTIASYAWSRVSGPTTFTLGSPNAATTTLSNLVQGTYVFKLTVTDNGGATASDNVTVTVNPPANQSPTANAGSNITLTLPANSTTLSGSGTDPDGTIASYAWSRVSGPTTFTIGTANAASTALSNLVQGTYVFRLTVTDNGGATATDDITVTVNPSANQSPTANAGANITLTLPTNSTTLSGSGTDPDGTIASYAWSRVSGPTTFTIATVNAATTALSNLVQGTYVFRLTVTDNGGATATDDVTVTVNAGTPTNQPPVAHAGNDIVMTLPTNSATLNGNTSTDADGTISSYAWTRVSGPTTFTLGTANAVTSSLSNLVQGTYVFRLTVTDNSGATATDDITVTVNAAANQVPTANAGNDIILTLPVNSTTLTGSGTDPDGIITTYAWSRVSGPTTFTLGNVSAASTGLTNLVQGTYVFRLTVTDNSGATGTDNVTVVVNVANPAPNQSPAANAGNDITLTLPSNSTTLGGSGSDPDGTIVAYNWTKVSGPATFLLPNASAASSSLSNLVQGVYVFRLTVTDNFGATATDNITVTVNAAPPGANQSPVARTSADSIILILPINSTSLIGTASTDPDGTIASYKWSQVSGPAPGTINDDLTAVAKVLDLTLGTYVFQLKVTDNSGASGTKTIKVIVKNKNGGGSFFNIYPNPSQGNMTMQYFSNLNGKCRISIYDARRRLVKDRFVDKSQVTLIEDMDVSNLRNGVYIIQVILPDGKVIAKQLVKM